MAAGSKVGMIVKYLDPLDTGSCRTNGDREPPNSLIEGLEQLPK